MGNQSICERVKHFGASQESNIRLPLKIYIISREETPWSNGLAQRMEPPSSEWDWALFPMLNSKTRWGSNILHSQYLSFYRRQYNRQGKYTGPKTIMIVGATSSYSLSFYCQIWYSYDNGSSETVVTKATMLDLDTNDEKYEFVIAFFSSRLSVTPLCIEGISQ